MQRLVNPATEVNILLIESKSVQELDLRQKKRAVRMLAAVPWHEARLYLQSLNRPSWKPERFKSFHDSTVNPQESISPCDGLRRINDGSQGGVPFGRRTPDAHSIWG